jgi:chitodextrinase
MKKSKQLIKYFIVVCFIYVIQIHTCIYAQVGTGYNYTPSYVSVTGGGAMPSTANGYTCNCDGTGATDATACLQTALNTAASQGKPLLIPATSNYYLVNGTLQVNTSVIGINGMPTLRQTTTTPFTSVLRLVNNMTGWISNLHIIGSYSGSGNGSTEYNHLINCGGVNGVTISGNLLEKALGDCVTENAQEADANACRNVLVTNNTMLNPWRCNVSFNNVTDRWAIMNNYMTYYTSYVNPVDIEPWRAAAYVTNVEVGYNNIISPNPEWQDGSHFYDAVVKVTAWFDNTPGGNVYIHHNYGDWGVPIMAEAGYQGSASTWFNVVSTNNVEGTTPPGSGVDTQVPTTPTNLNASSITQTSFNLTWTASTDNVGVQAYEVKQGGTWLAEPTTTSYSVTGLTCGTTYNMTVGAFDAAGNYSGVATKSVTTSACNTCTLPSGWSGSNIGVSSGQSSCESGGTYTIVGAGADIWGTADQFRFTHKSLSGDGEITAKVLSIQNTNAWAKSGVMIRESLAVGSKHVSCVLTPSNGVAIQSRSATNGTSVSTAVAGIAAPYWVRVKRVGNTFTAYRSSNGTSWTQVGAATTVAMTSNVYIGLAVTSHAAGVGCTSTISNVSIATGSADTQAPSVPSGLASSAIAQTSFTLSWTASTDNVGVTGYEVFKGGVSVGTTTSTSMSITGLTCNTAYSMTVKARDAAGNWSAASTAKSVTTSSCAITNMLINPGFESALTTGWSDNWGNATQNTTMTYVRTGTKSLKVGPAQGGIAQNLTSGFTVGGQYTISAYCRYSATGSGAGIGVLAYNGTTQIANFESADITSTTFTQYYVTFTVPANTTKLQAYVWYNGGTPSLYCDDFILATGTQKSAKIPNEELDLIDESPNEILIYPNPASSTITISNLSINASIMAMSIDGKMIGQMKSSNERTLSIDIKNWNKGIYILKIVNNGDLTVKKVIVE